MGQPSNYGLCDFCHLPHEQEKLEKVKVTYKKCTDCEVSLVPQHTHEAIEEPMQQVERPQMKNFMNRPPQHLAGAFNPPPEQSL